MTPAEFRQIRLSLGLTQAGLGCVLRCGDVDPGRTIRRYEAGERKIPALVAVVMQERGILALLGVSFG